VEGVVAGDIHLVHVRDVESASGPAHGMVLVDLRAEMHRHGPPGEIDDPCASAAVAIV
jgi:hypothetical protein